MPDHERMMRALEIESDEISGTLPWDNPNSNPLEDIRRALKAMHDSHYMNRTVTSIETISLTEESELSDSVAIVSGGLDSITLVYHMISEGYKPHLLSFDYGQRHKKELGFARITANALGLQHNIIDLTGITHLISNSALTSGEIHVLAEDPNTSAKQTGEHHSIEVPDGHYAEETMKATVVPNRNMMMLSIAAAVAVNNKYRCIATGVHSGDHFIYPDCRPEFIEGMNNIIPIANADFHNFDGFQDPTTSDISSGAIWAPFLSVSKADIAFRALELGVPLHLTWSCYKGGENHCGKCGTCVERLEAIAEAQMRWAKSGKMMPQTVIDDTVYDDTKFWKVATREKSNAGEV